MSERRHAARRAAERPGARRTAWVAAVIGAIALLGVGALFQPFTWDQAVFALGAERLSAGGRLYVDYWDFKQPGIFWFFAVAGRLFGMREPGIHVLELLWVLALAWLLTRVARRWLGETASALAPLAVCGFYYAVAGSWHLLQVEGLAGLPLTLSLAAAWRAERAGRRDRWAWCAAGVAGGVVLLFKLALAPVLAAVWAVPVWDRLRREPARDDRVRVALLALSALALGTLLSLVAGLGALGGPGVFGRTWWSWVEYPAQLMSRLHGMPVRNLASTGGWLLRNWSLMFAAAAVGTWSVLRRRDDGYGRSLLAWLASGSVVFLMQRWSGWQYQVFLVLVPLGLLATRGLASLAEAVRGRWPGPRSARVVQAVLLGAAAWTFAGATSRTIEAVACGALTDAAAARDLVARRSGGAYDYFARLTEFLLAPGAAPGAIYVLGNPLAYWVSGRPPAVAMPGGMSIYTAREWEIIARELAAARPPYILLEDPMAAALQERRAVAAPLLDLLDRDYRDGARLGQARWLVRRETDP